MTAEQHDRTRLELGAYLIGSLAPAERAAVDQHLATCQLCRDELAELAPLPGLLARLDADEARHQVLTPSPDLLSRALAAVRAEQALEHRRLRRWRIGASVATAAAVIAVAVAAVPAALPDSAAHTPFTVAAGSTAAGMGSMEERTWGTAVELDLSGLPPAVGYQAFAMARDGRSDVVATWGVTPSGRAVVNGATAIQRDDLASIDVRTADGRPLLSLPCRY